MLIKLYFSVGFLVTSADVAAKESLDFNITDSQVLYTDLKPHINYFISNKWQERWSSYPDNKLFKIKPTIGEWQPGFRNSRTDEVVLSRLRIGHTYFLIHIFNAREILLNAQHARISTLSDCMDFGLLRPRFYTVPDMETLFDTVSVDRILSFVKEVNMFAKI